MSQSFDLVSTPRTEPTVRPTVGDIKLAYAGVIPVGYLALFDPADIRVLPWDRTHRQLTLFAPKAAALARLGRRAPAVARLLARDLAVRAARQAKRGAAGGVRPAAETLRAALAAFARRVESAPGSHVQAFLDDSYYPWHEEARASLAVLLSAADAGDGWSEFTAFSEVANPTTPPWGDVDVENVTTGMTNEGPAYDSLASWLAEGELLPGTLVAVCEALGAPSRARPPGLAELLGALARVIGVGVALRATTSSGVVTACAPAPTVDLLLPRASLPPLASREAPALFTELAELWDLAARGALADGALECSALELSADALAPASPEQAPAPFEPCTLSPDPGATAALADLDPDDAHALAAALTDPAPQVRVALIADAGDLLDATAWAGLVADPSPAVRAAAVRCPDCPLDMPPGERHPGVRASSRTAHPLELVLLAAHPEPSVRAAVADNAHTPVRTRCALARDPEPEVRRAAVWPLCQAAFPGGRGDAAAERSVTELARDAVVAVRLAVGRSLGHLAPHGAHLGVTLADDPDPAVAELGRRLRDRAEN